jgi:hypothetical protein
MYATTQGQYQIDYLNQPGIRNVIRIGDYPSHHYSENSEFLDLNEDEFSVYKLAHELDHMFYDIFYQRMGKFDPSEEGYKEHKATYSENYYHAVFRDFDFRTYRAGSWNYSSEYFSASPQTYNPLGETMVITNSVLLGGTKEQLLDESKNGAYTMKFSKFSANAPEVKNATSGLLMFYNYRENYSSEWKQMVVKVDIYRGGVELK